MSAILNAWDEPKRPLSRLKDLSYHVLVMKSMKNTNPKSGVLQQARKQLLRALQQDEYGVLVDALKANYEDPDDVQNALNELLDEPKPAKKSKAHKVEGSSRVSQNPTLHYSLRGSLSKVSKSSQSAAKTSSSIQQKRSSLNTPRRDWADRISDGSMVPAISESDQAASRDESVIDSGLSKISASAFQMTRDNRLDNASGHATVSPTNGRRTRPATKARADTVQVDEDSETPILDLLLGTTALTDSLSTNIANIAKAIQLLPHSERIRKTFPTPTGTLDYRHSAKFGMFLTLARAVEDPHESDPEKWRRELEKCLVPLVVENRKYFPELEGFHFMRDRA